jgi:drug/metabolite transporter (DMT)-like permease
MPSLAEISMRLTRLAIVTAPALFVLLWSTGFIGARYGLPDIEPLTFLAVRMGFVVLIMAAIAIIGDVARWRLLTSEQSQLVMVTSSKNVVGTNWFLDPSWTQTVFSPFPGSPSTYCR